MIKVGGIFIDMAMNVAKLRSDVRDANNVLRGFQRDVANIKSVVGGVAGGLGIALVIREVFELNSALLRLAQVGEKFGSIEDSFRALGGSSGAVADARKATLGLVDSFDLMQIANKGLLAGIPNFNKNFAQIADLGARVANVLGTDTKTQIESLTTAIINGNVKALRPYGFALQGVKGHANLTAVAIEQVQGRISKLPPVTESAANAAISLANAWKEGTAEAGKALNANEGLAESFGEMESNVSRVDWTTFGNNLAAVHKLLVDLANLAVTPLVTLFNDLNLIIEATFNTSTRSQIADLDSKLAGLIDNRDNNLGGGFLGGGMAAHKARLQKEIDEVQAKRTALLATLQEELRETGKAGVEGATGLGTLGTGAGEAADEIEKLREKLSGLKENLGLDSLKDQIKKAIDSQDRAAFDSLTAKFKDATSAGIRDSFKELTSASDLLELEDYIKESTGKGLDKFEEEFKKKSKEISDDLEKKQKQAHQESVDFWRTTFENAITGTTFSLKDALKQVAVGFASEIAASIFGGFSGVGSPQDFGGFLANQLFGSVDFGSALGITGPDGLMSSLGLGDLAGAGGLSGMIGSFGGGAGVMLADGSIVAAGSEAAAAGIGSAAMPGTGMLGAMGPWGAAAAGALLVGSQTNWFGLGGGVSNPETIGRNDWAEKIEELIDKVGGVTYIDEQGRRRTVTDIGSRIYDDFNGFNADTDLFGRYGNEVSNAFLGIGGALANMYGSSDLDSGQAGVMLAESFGGSIEGLKALVDSLGLSFEDVTENLVQLGMKGEQSWLAIVSQIRDSSAAFQDGLEGSGQFAKAFENLLGTNGTGAVALNQVKNIAVELKEAGITSIDAARAAIEATGQFSQEEIDALFESFKMHNIDTVDEILSLDDLGLANIVASMDAWLQDHGGQWREATDEASEYADTLDEIPDKAKKELHIDVTTTIDGTTRAAISSGLFDGTALSGINGTSTITAPTGGGVARGMSMISAPSNYSDSNISSAGARGYNRGVSIDQPPNIYINVDAKGAEVGVESRVMGALEAMHQRIISDTVDIVNEELMRGRL